MEEGKKNGDQGKLSKRLVEMLAKQELIRHSLEDLRQDIDNKNDLNTLQNAIEHMQETEKDIANKNITMESLNRQKEILTKLLEVENALREQEQDEKRESKTNLTDYDRIVQEAYETYEAKKMKQTEMIKTTPPSLKTYYKRRIDRYFNLLIQKQ